MTRRVFAGLGGALAALLLVAGAAPGRVPRLGDAAPEIAGESWINSDPLTMARLRGRVVLVEFWTYG